MAKSTRSAGEHQKGRVNGRYWKRTTNQRETSFIHFGSTKRSWTKSVLAAHVTPKLEDSWLNQSILSRITPGRLVLLHHAACLYTTHIAMMGYVWEQSLPSLPPEQYLIMRQIELFFFLNSLIWSTNRTRSNLLNDEGYNQDVCEWSATVSLSDW